MKFICKLFSLVLLVLVLKEYPFESIHKKIVTLMISIIQGLSMCSLNFIWITPYCIVFSTISLIITHLKFTYALSLYFMITVPSTSSHSRGITLSSSCSIQIMHVFISTEILKLPSNCLGIIYIELIKDFIAILNEYNKKNQEYNVYDKCNLEWIVKPHE